MTGHLIKKFYRSADILSLKDGGWGVTLDGRPLRTPSKQVLRVPTKPLARAIATEWDSQVDHIRPHTMSLMQHAATALDRVAPNRAAVVRELAGYGATDLLCYRADSPRELAGRQAAAWDPLLAWLKQEYGVGLAVTEGVMPIGQAAGALKILHMCVDRYEPLRLAPLHTATTLSGSVVIGLALLTGRLNADEAFTTCRIDETFQTEHWGEDPEAAERGRRLHSELRAAERFLSLLGRVAHTT